MKTLGRVGLWLAAFLVCVTLFSLLWGAASFTYILKQALLSALPVWLLFVPVVLTMKDAEKHRLWITLAIGALIGPASLALWGFILQLKGADTQTTWQGDGIGFGVLQGMVLALVVGSLTTALYVTSLKVMHRR